MTQVYDVQDVIKSICNWNGARYEQEFNRELTIALLEEEVSETELARKTNNPVEIIDGLGDIFYVAIGAIWKMGKSTDEIFSLLNSLSPHNSIHIRSALDQFKADSTVMSLGVVAISAFNELTYAVKSPTVAVEVINAICISNDTKEVVKTGSNVKANVVKGDGYKSPTAALEAIVARCNDVR